MRLTLLNLFLPSPLEKVLEHAKKVGSCGPIFLMFMIMGSPARGPFDDDRFVGVMVLFMLALLYLGYCIWTYVVLLNSRYGAEFG